MSSIKAQAAVEQWALQHQMIPEQLDPLALEIRESYVQHRRMMFPGYRLAITRYDRTFWRKVAMLFTELKADPQVYITMAFHLFGPKTYPESLLSPQIQMAYNAEAVDTTLTDGILIDMQLYATKLQEYRTRNPDRSLSDLLLDREVCPADVFAWCVATAANLPEVAKKRETLALPLLRRPAYRKIYSQAFPGAFNGNT